MEDFKIKEVIDVNYALIFAGGTGQRMNTVAKPKQFLSLHDKPILIHTIEFFEFHQQIDKIVVVCLSDWIEALREQLFKFGIKKTVKIVRGGITGQQSIYNGLKAIQNIESSTEDVLVLIHDGVRPLIDEQLITDNIIIAREKGNAISAAIATETVMSVVDDIVNSIADRQCTRIAKAPQTFFINDILTLHEKAITDNLDGFVDSASMANHYGNALNLVLCSNENIKITTAADFYILRALYEARENSQILGL